jgi:pimeloyl-ACP methyl ester carboxylesterase
MMAVMYLVGCIVLFAAQRSLIYYPQPSFIDTATSKLNIPVAGAELQVSYRQHNGTNALIYFGGNAEDVSRNLPEFSAAFPDYALYLLHYRSYGGSSGTPTEETIQQDALVLFDKVYAKHQRIILIGRSLGTGVAIRLASLRPGYKLVLITPYNSLEEVARFHFPYIPVSWLLLDKYESWRYAPQITVPTLILEAEHDNVIPHANTEKLQSHFKNGLVLFKVLADTDHNSLSKSPHYIPLLKEFVYGQTQNAM